MPTAPSRRILVVDDNRDQALSLQMLLKLSGHDVLIAHDGAGAFELARAFRPEVALIDLGMPGMNGYELAVSLREEPELRDILLIAQTGWADEQHRRTSKASGFDHHLAKPIELEMLNELLAATKTENQ